MHACKELLYRGHAGSGSLVHIPDLRRSERYSSIVPLCGTFRTAVLFSRVGYAPPGHNHYTAHWGTLARLAKDRNSFGSAHLVLEPSKHVSHNAVFLCHEGKILGYGGRDRRFKKTKRDIAGEIGIFLLSSQMDEKSFWQPMWTAQHVIAGSHQGCVERRAGLRGVCEFDGRLSAVSLSINMSRGSVLLFARANTKANGGGRFVQVTRSENGISNWSPFQLIRFACGKPAQAKHAFAPRCRSSTGAEHPLATFVFDGWALLDVYFFVVKLLRNGSLVALFPATFSVCGRGELPHGGVFVAFSRDGLSWSTPTQIMRSRVTADPSINVANPHYRTDDYPVDWVETSDGGVSIQIQHNILLYDNKPTFVNRNTSDIALNDLARSTSLLSPHHCRYQVGPSQQQSGARIFREGLPEKADACASRGLESLLPLMR